MERSRQEVAGRCHTCPQEGNGRVRGEEVRPTQFHKGTLLRGPQLEGPAHSRRSVTMQRPTVHPASLCRCCSGNPRCHMVLGGPLRTTGSEGSTLEVPCGAPAGGVTRVPLGPPWLPEAIDQNLEPRPTCPSLTGRGILSLRQESD